MGHALVLSTLLVALLGQIPLPSGQPRDARPPDTTAGTAAIRGRVYSVETGAPVRRVVVQLMPASGVPPPPAQGRQSGPEAGAATGAGRGGRLGGRGAAGTERTPALTVRNTATDESGKFGFTGLPPGSYRLRVSPGPYTAQYLPTTFGAASPMEPGTTIELKAGQEFDQANVPLVRGGAINGRVVDDMGEPLSRVMVYASRRMPGSGQFQRTGGGMVQSDDWGRYRIYGLEPGEYVVAAEARGMGGPPIDDVEPEAFTTTYHPAVLNDSDAERIRVRAGADAEGIDIQLQRTRAFRISGTVTDSRGNVVENPSLMLVKPSLGGFSSSGVQPGGAGAPRGGFVIRDVVPGDYVLVVRPGGFGPQPPSADGRRTAPEYASMPITVASDIDDLVIVTQPGVTIAGRVVFADGDPPNAGNIRISTQPGSRLPMFGPSAAATAGPDGRFTLTDLSGAVFVRPQLQRDWAIKAITLGGTDITDTPVEFRKEHSGQLQILLTTRASSIEGVVTGDGGAPVEQAMVLVFPEEKEAWRLGSPRVRTGMSQKDGKYVVSGLVGGRYHAVAFAYRSVMLSPDLPPEFFERLARDATAVVVADDERRVVDLQVTTPPER